MFFATLALCLATFFAWRLVLHRRDSRRRRGVPFPPGPKPELLLGNMRHIPKEQQWSVYGAWKKNYGDIVHLKSFGRHIVVLNSYEVAHDMLDKSAALYSSRPFHPMAHLCRLDLELGFLPYGSTWRDRRKLLHQSINKASMVNFHDSLLSGTHRLLQGALDKPSEWDQHLRLCMGGTVLKTAYGFEAESLENMYLVTAEKAAEPVFKVLFGSYIVDFFPFLQHLPAPILPFQRDSKAWKASILHSLHVPFEQVRQQLVMGNAPPSIASSLIDKYPDEDVMGACTVMYTAATDTSVMSIKSMLLGVAIFPDVLKNAQEELDRVLGNTKDHVVRLPSFEDRASLPYIEAILKEATRWHVAAPLGVSHTSNEDNVFRGYFIPKESFIWANIWAMSRDTKYYPNPDEFKPERFLGPSPALDPFKFIFGFGRRVCVGQHYADAAVWFAIVSLLAAFDVKGPIGLNGKEERFTMPEGHAGGAPSVKLRIEPRSEEFAAVVRAAGAEAARN